MDIKSTKKNHKENKKNEELYNKWTDFIEKYKIYFVSNEEIWNDNLQKVIDYIDKCNKRPSNSDKNYDYKILAQWISHQQQNYKKNKGIMKDEKIKKIWEEFINEYKIYFQSNEEQWFNNLKEVEKYININNKRPNQDEKILSKWISHQITNYKNKEQIMKNEEIYNKWTKFINDPRYKNYF
jgi:hypothetical protein